MTRHVGFRAKALPIIGVVAATLSSWSASARPDLTAVNVTPKGDDLTVELKLSEPAPEAAVFALETPPRISIDLPGTGVALDNRRMSINQGVVQSLTAIETADRSRIVLNLTSLPQYSVNSSGSSVLIRLSSGAPASATPAGVAAAAGIERTRGAISKMDFRRSETGAGRLLLELGSDTADVDIRNEGGKIVALFRNTQVADESLIARMDVLDFATPIKFVDTTKEGINTKVTLTPVAGAQFEQVAYQLGRTFTIELQPLTQREIAEIERLKPEFTGERLNVNFQNIEVRALLQIIADVAGKNLVTSDSVKGDITLRLENVPWDQALDIVLRTKGLSKTENGNVIWVAPTGEVAAQQAQEIEAKTQAEQLAPLITEMIQVNYAKAVELATLIGTREGEEDEGSFLSPRGRVSVDERTNTLIVRDTRDKLEDLQRLITRLDIPVRQVLIESRLVVANDDFSRSIGSSVGFGFAELGSTTVAGSGNIGAATQLQNIASGTNIDEGDDPNRLSTQFGATSQGQRVPSYALSILGSDFLVDLELSAIQAEGKGEVISNPRVVTADGKEAIIEQGEEIPFTSGGTGVATATTQFKEAVLALRVTPQITPDNRVIMDLEVSKDSRGEVVPQATGGSAVAIDTSSVTTQVLVNNAETVVLGGIYEQDRSENVSKVPILGDIPLIGYLFRNRSVSNNKRELLIFVTPKILSQGINAN